MTCTSALMVLDFSLLVQVKRPSLRHHVDASPTAVLTRLSNRSHRAGVAGSRSTGVFSSGMPVDDALAGRHSVAHHLRGSSLNRALDVVGDWWTQLILRECFLGVRNFEVFHSRLGLPRQTLTVRLRALVGHGILDTGRGAYRLTARGLALYPWALMIWRWTSVWGVNADRAVPPALTHLDCGHATIPVFGCAACRAEVQVRDVTYRDAPGRVRAAAPGPGAGTRWAGGRYVSDAGAAERHGAFVTADRWTHLIISAVFLGCRSFERLEREVGIAPNILAHRLALLVAAGFLAKQRSPDDARRFLYTLTDRSRDVFPLTISLVQWADQWLPARRGPPMLRFHRPCGSALHAVALCSHCGRALLPHRVAFAGEAGAPPAFSVPSIPARSLK